MPCGFCLNGNVQHRLLWMVSVSVYIFWGPKEKILMCIFFGPKGNILMYIFLGAERKYFSVYIFWGPKGNILMYIFLGAERKYFSVYIFWGPKGNISVYMFSGAERKDFIPRKRASHGFLIRQEKKKRFWSDKVPCNFSPWKRGQVRLTRCEWRRANFAIILVFPLQHIAD